MPQIAQIGEIYASQLFWLAIFFGLSIIVIGYGMLPKIMKTVEDRDAKIAADLAEAKAAQENADGLEEGYREKLDESRAFPASTRIICRVGAASLLVIRFGASG